MADAKPLGDGWFIVEDGDTRYRFAAAGDGNGTWVFVNGQVALIADERGTTSAGRPRARESSVSSPMPATVVAINAAVGQSVAEGQTVIVLEAMKMELPIKAPKSGVVKAVHCAKGDLVQPGVTLLELD